MLNGQMDRQNIEDYNINQVTRRRNNIMHTMLIIIRACMPPSLVTLNLSLTSFISSSLSLSRSLDQNGGSRGGRDNSQSSRLLPGGKCDTALHCISHYKTCCPFVFLDPSIFVTLILIKHVVHSSFIQEVAEGNNTKQLRLLIYATHLSLRRKN